MSLNPCKLIDKMPTDKRGHAICGSILFNILIAFGFTIIHALILVTAAGIAKEIYDALHRDTHTPEVLDAVATVSLAALEAAAIFAAVRF